MIAVISTSLQKCYRCCGCAQKIHHECLPKALQHCDGGAIGKMIVLHNEILKEDNGLTVKIPEGKTPVLVFINSKSGANQGEPVLRKLLSYLNRHQVYDLADGGPKKGLLFFKDVPNLRIMACGGDGTFGWIQSAIDDLGEWKFRYYHDNQQVK